MKAISVREAQDFDRRAQEEYGPACCGEVVVRGIGLVYNGREA